MAAPRELIESSSRSSHRSTGSTTPTLAIVIPIYNESAGLEQLFTRLRPVLDGLRDVDSQVVYVNDGSTDGSLEIMLDHHARDRRFVVIDLSRNFGQQAAIAAGLAASAADATVVMDGDLQDPPELIPEMVASWRAGAEVVQARRRTRQERGLRRWSLMLFHGLFGWLADFPIPAHVGVFGLLDRKALDELNRLGEKNRFLPGLRSWVGFEQRVVHYDRGARGSGLPKQSFGRLLHYALNGIFSFSYKPLRLMVLAGSVICALGFVLAARFVIRRLAGVEQAQMGFTTLVTLVLFMGGVQLLSIGLLGEYLARIYDEVKARPLFIVRRRYPDGSERSGKSGTRGPDAGMTRPSNERARWLRRSAAVAGLLAVYYVLAISAASGKSMTFDEMAHLTAGYTYWAFNDYRLHPENGNLPQRLAALPAVLRGAGFPRLDQQAWTTSNVYAIGDQFFYSSGNDADTLLRRSRAVMALLGVALGALIYGWSRRLVSPGAAWVSLLLFVFSPTFLAHGPLVTSDIAAALFFTATVGAIWVALHRLTPMTVLVAAVLTGGAFLSKLSAPILIPVAIVMTMVRLIDGRPLTARFRGRSFEFTNRVRQLAIVLGVAVAFGLVTWTLIWASFGFRYAAFAAATTGKDVFLGQISEQPGAAGWFLSAARRLHLLPEAYLYGSALTVQFAAERAAFLNGQFSTTGWWWYFPYAFAVKTTIPAMIVGLLALAALVRRWRDPDASGTWMQRARASLYAGTPLLALIAVYGVFALTTNLNIGHRHLLPVYPALCILAGGAAFWLQPLFGRMRTTEPPNAANRRQQRSARAGLKGRAGLTGRAGLKTRPYHVFAIATGAMLVWHVAESVTIRPDYLAYFNQLAGGPSEGYKHLADSSLDWGQDLPALKQWLDREGLQRPGAGNVYLSYFGTARPDYYGIKAIPLAGFIDRRPPQPPDPLGGGVYCISATVLDVIGPSFYKPEDEGNYQAALRNLIAFARASENEAAWSALLRQTGERYWHDLFKQFDQLRTGRLVAFLRNRQPEATVGYSILIYRLTDGDVALAMNGPAPGGPR